MGKKRKGKKPADEHGTMTVDEQLDELFEENWDDVEPRSFEEVPNASYQCRLLAAILNNAQSSGRFQCSWEWIIIEGDYKGRHLFIHQGMDTEDGIGYFKGALNRLGYEDYSTKKELIETLEAMVEGPTYAVIRVSTSKKKIDGEVQEFQNKRIIKALDSDEVTDDLEEGDLTPAKEAASETEDDWAKGDRVKVDMDGTYYEGAIKKIKKNSATIEFDDGDVESVSLDELEEVEAATAESESEDWKKGDRVKTEIDGTSYEGIIKKIKTDTATVEFDDGDVEDIALDELEAAEEETPTEKESEESTCELSVTKFTSVDRRVVKKLAKENEFDPDDFDNNALLLCEIGDYCGLSGEFKNPAALIEAIKDSAK